MAPSLEPVAELSPLPKADGSASFSYGGYSVTAAVAGPIEAPRREEQAFEAFVDVVVRPAAGTGGMYAGHPRPKLSTPLYHSSLFFSVCVHRDCLKHMKHQAPLSASSNLFYRLRFDN